MILPGLPTRMFHHRKISGIVCAICILMAGCARIADPKPPEHRVPEAVYDLDARMIGDEAVLTFSLPERNTDGSPARNIRSLEVFRITEKSETGHPASLTDLADLSEKNFLDRATRVFSIPAARFPEYTRGKVFVVRDSPPATPETNIYSLRFRYAAVFVNEKSQAAGLGRQAIVQPVALPPAPRGLTAVVTENEIFVAWTPSPEKAEAALPYRVAYNVYRSETLDDFPDIPANSVPLPGAEYRDGDFQFDKNYYYAVSVVAVLNPPAESARSEILKVEARDIFPPAPPGNFTAVAEDGKITLFWTPSPSEDVAGYRIFRKNRAENREGYGRPLHEGLITGISYRDESMEPEGDYIYEIQAIDGHGNASETVELSD